MTFEIDVVAESDTHWMIYRDDGLVQMQRKYAVRTTDASMDDDEEMICALCRKINRT